MRPRSETSYPFPFAQARIFAVSGLSPEEERDPVAPGVLGLSPPAGGGVGSQGFPQPLRVRGGEVDLVLPAIQAELNGLLGRTALEVVLKNDLHTLRQLSTFSLISLWFAPGYIYNRNTLNKPAFHGSLEICLESVHVVGGCCIETTAPWCV